jgi:hypothetical protein
MKTLSGVSLSEGVRNFMKQSPFFAGLLALCLVIGFSACPASMLDNPLETPGNFTIVATRYMAYLSWESVPNAATYRIRLNGEEVHDETATSWRHDNTVALGDEYTVSAVYSSGQEGHPAGPLAVKNLGYVYPLAAGEVDNSSFIRSGSGTTRPARWYDAAVSPGQRAHYYIIPIDKNNTAYRIWWNDSAQGDGTKTLDVKVSAQWYVTNASINSDVNAGYTSAGITITPNSAGNTGYVVLKVEPSSSGGTGTYGIAYNYD